MAKKMASTLPLVGEVHAAGSSVLELRNDISEELEPFKTVEFALLQPGDTLAFSVWQHSDLHYIATIEPDGMVTFPLVGRLKASGRTVEEIKSLTQKKLRGYIRDAQVTILPTFLNRRMLHDYKVSVLASQLQPRRVAIIGEVGVQGLTPIDGSLKLVDALAQARLQRKTASLNSIVVIRNNVSGNPQYRRIRLDDFFDGEAPEQNIYLQNDDIVIVPKTFIAKTGDYVEQFFTRTAPTFAWWSAFQLAKSAKDQSETPGLINESLRRDLLDISP